ncbi:MAG: MBL fold metallo-hydrolase [Pseudomonadales bacterium]
MRLASIGSGSRGNGTLVASDNTCVLIDCGFSLPETRRRLALLDHSIDDIDAVLVTHEHGDHIRGVAQLAKRHGIKIYMTHGTASAQKKLDYPVEIISSHRSFVLGDLLIEPVPVPHDAREPCQYIVSRQQLRLGVLTDLGHISSLVAARYHDCDCLFIESNHDTDMLAAGAYPPQLQARVGGMWGHLSNRQTAEFIPQLNLSRMSTLVLGHISDKNNTLDLVRKSISTVENLQAEVVIADQANGSQWLSAC